MSVYSTLIATTQDNQAPKLIALLKQFLPETRAFSGCISMKILQCEENPNEFIFSGRWESSQHYKNYLAFRAEQGALEKIGALLVSPPEIRISNDILL